MSKLLAPMRVNANVRLHVATLQDRIAELEAQLAALQPWAEVGKRAVNLYWWWHDASDPVHCLMCMRPDGDHAPDCPIPALLAQLEGENGNS